MERCKQVEASCPHLPRCARATGWERPAAGARRGAFISTEALAVRTQPDSSCTAPASSAVSELQGGGGTPRPHTQAGAPGRQREHPLVWSAANHLFRPARAPRQSSQLPNPARLLSGLSHGSWGVSTPCPTQPGPRTCQPNTQVDLRAFPEDPSPRAPPESEGSEGQQGRPDSATAAQTPEALRPPCCECRTEALRQPVLPKATQEARGLGHKLKSEFQVCCYPRGDSVSRGGGRGRGRGRETIACDAYGHSLALSGAPWVSFPPCLVFRARGACGSRVLARVCRDPGRQPDTRSPVCLEQTLVPRVTTQKAVTFCTEGLCCDEGPPPAWEGPDLHPRTRSLAGYC